MVDTNPMEQMMPDELDVFERRILTTLQKDATRSTTEIASDIGLSQAPCWRRIQRLKSERYIRSQVCILDPTKLGLNTQVFASIKLSSHGRANVSACAQEIAAFSEVLECFLILGTADLMLKIITEDNEAYRQLFFERLSQVTGVQEINSMVVLSEIKSTTELPIRATGR